MSERLNFLPEHTDTDPSEDNFQFPIEREVHSALESDETLSRLQEDKEKPDSDRQNAIRIEAEKQELGL